MSPILVLTPIAHIEGLSEKLSKVAEVILEPDAELSQIERELSRASAVFTNPNKARFYLGEEFFRLAQRLEVIATASTGTNHIDLEAAAARGVAVLSLAKDYETINQISSTAEHALALTLAGLRNLFPAFLSAKSGDWDYEPFIGRQVSSLCIGVVGLGRLGSMYAKYSDSLGARVLFYDPYVAQSELAEKVEDLNRLFAECDIVSIHVHHTPETDRIIGGEQFRLAKSDLLLVNTSRGEIVDEPALIQFLKGNPRSRFYADVVSGEQSRRESPIYRYSFSSSQVFLTPHIGGMTVQGQKIAYEAAVTKLAEFVRSQAV